MDKSNSMLMFSIMQVGVSLPKMMLKMMNLSLTMSLMVPTTMETKK